MNWARSTGGPVIPSSILPQTAFFRSPRTRTSSRCTNSTSGARRRGACWWGSPPSAGSSPGRSLGSPAPSSGPTGGVTSRWNRWGAPSWTRSPSAGSPSMPSARSATFLPNAGSLNRCTHTTISTAWPAPRRRRAAWTAGSSSRTSSIWTPSTATGTMSRAMPGSWSGSMPRSARSWTRSATRPCSSSPPTTGTIPRPLRPIIRASTCPCWSTVQGSAEGPTWEPAKRLPMPESLWPRRSVRPGLARGGVFWRMGHEAMTDARPFQACAVADAGERDATIPYREIPHFPVSTAAGHASNLVLGMLEGKPVVVMQGRVHFYEGYALGQVVFPVRVMRELGAGTLLVSNAAGGLNRQWNAGDLMVIADHMNFMGTNPLIGPNEEAFGARFPDMARPYDPDLVRLAERVAVAERVPLRKGVYVAVSGPSYETAAELRMLARWGADAVGMSTVPEVIAARQMGIRALGFSAITDMATGEVVESVTHEAVLAVARELEPRFVRLVRRIIREMEL